MSFAPHTHANISYGHFILVGFIEEMRFLVHINSPFSKMENEFHPDF